MKNSHLAVGCALLGCASLLPVRAGQVSPEKKMVWAHAMIVFPLDMDVLKPWLPEGYQGPYVSYPLDSRRSYPNARWHPADIRSAKAAGLDGFSVDIFVDGHAADGYLQAADEAGGFHIAACLDGGDEAQNIEAVATYCDSARSHPSAAKVGDAFVIFTYDAPHLAPQAWSRVRAELARRGHKTWWMPDLGADLSQPGAQEKQKAASFFPAFEAGYNFGSTVGNLGDVAAFYRAGGKFYGGGMMPGYYRVGAGNNDARATAAYRDEWKRHIAARLSWAHVSTWNDLAETTAIMPTSDFNLTRSDLTAWFAAKFRGQEVAWKSPRLYITTPKSVYRNRPYIIEGLALNASRRPVQVSVQVLDAARQPLGDPATAMVQPGQDGAANVSLSLKAFPPSRFLRARATLRQGQQVLASVLSAPIVVLDEEAQPGFVTLYTSIPARQSLPQEVKIALDGTPSMGRKSRARIVTDVAKPQFSEVIFNGEVLHNFLAEPPTPLEVPRLNLKAVGVPANPSLQPMGEIKGGTWWGFYLARVTDAGYRVGYSDPIYVAPPSGDLKLKESFAFDEGAGTFALDASLFRRAGELQNVAWIKPGAGESGSALSFNGTDARVNLTLYGTPVGPLSVKMAVRPRAYGGFFFCDSGGMWMATTPEGRPLFTRLGPDGWATAVGQSTLPLNAWTQTEWIWDGAKLKILIGGKPDGEAPCAPAFGSGRRALGCNPFGSGSAYYNGDLDQFEMRALPTK